ncbi:Ig-like domain-containing protein [Tahibacter amnicola]|uniref:Ig-like domain-containing protein n=1 Tax=Tahibacter amnicola TaxID=2976241 RepID=A0ABY6BKC6_9GAMM|nr:Ig-like domain-containing protein [Tahibacter amnicola]UXI70224.1 Ig-like domain-containing protein [Tahibacter amnicola]
MPSQNRSGIRKPLCSLMAALAFSGLAQAQLPPVVPGFPTNVSCTPGQLLSRQVGFDRTTSIIYHNGRLYSNDVTGGVRREWLFTTPSDPTTLTVVNNTAAVPWISDHGNHGHSKSGDYAGNGGGMRLRRVSPGVNANFDTIPESFYNVQTPPPGAFGLHHLYYPWAVPFHPISYSPSPGVARLWRANQLLAEWDALVDHGVAGNGVLIGNLLFIVSDQSMLGVLAYDIAPVFDTPPRPPQLLDKLPGAIGGYLGPAVWENYLLMVGGTNQDQMIVVDYSDPANLRLVTTIDLRGTASMNAGSNVPYIQTQDQYVFARRHKIDMERLEPVLELDEVGNARPAGSVSGALDVSQYTLPLGNLLVSGAYSAPGRDGVGVWCHQATPDTRSPTVGYHVPRPDQTNFPVGAPITLVISETLESFTIVNGTSVIVRPLGGEPVAAWTSFAHDRLLTITPRSYLAPNTTYEVVIPAGGIKDAAGNGIEGYTFRFSTGATAMGGNAAPVISAFSADQSPVAPGTSVTFTASATDPENDALQYRFTFGDGSAATAWSSTPSASHSFAEAGHFDVKLQVRDLKPGGTVSTVVDTTMQTVAAIPANPLPTHSSTLSLDDTRRTIWVVDPDNDAVIRYGADSRTVQQRIDLRALLASDNPVHPTSVAVTPAGEAWITARDADRVLVLSATGQLLANIDTGYGSAPQAVAIQRDGVRAFVSLARRGNTDRNNGQLVQYATATRTESGRLELGPGAHAIALTGNGSRAFVSRLISREHYGEVWDINATAMTLTRTLPLWRDRGVPGLDSGGSDGPGVPNYITSLVLAPQQDWLWYTAVKADTNRGLFFKLDTLFNQASTHDSTVRPVLGRINLTAAGGVPQEPGRAEPGAARGRVDIDNADSPSALVFSPRGDYAFAALQGNNTIAVFDDFAIRGGAGRSTVWRLPSGAAPQGLLLDTTTQTLWSQNLLSRDVTAIPVGDFLRSGTRTLAPATIPSGVAERLSPEVLAGKRTFYFAGDSVDGINDMSFEGYISCASCHLDGGHDGRTWDFTQRGEGFRNTTTLHGRHGMQHGNVHWTGNFDEIQDFVLDMVNEFRGRGFLPPGQEPHPSLGSPNAGRSAELDQLAAYVASLDPFTIPRSPYRQPNGTLTSGAQAGAAVFTAQGCGSCHLPGAEYTDSSVGTATLHNVGTLRDSSGQRLGQTLAGIDTPTLIGVWETGPYFHDGSATRLEDVFSVTGGRMLQAEHAQLNGSAFMDNFPQFNSDSSAHGRHVQGIDSAGDGVTWTNVEGTAGNGAIEVRFIPSVNGTIRLRVNGTTVRDHSFLRQPTHFEWTRVRFEDIPLQAGATNTVVLELTQFSNGWEPISIDDITVSTTADRALAEPHRRVLALPGADMANLLAFLRELDGRDANGEPPNADRLFADGFE